MPRPLPAIFIGHGSPMNAIQTNAYTDAWASLGARIPRPKAILCISAHWYVEGTSVTAMPQPRTIHDFGGFPRELREVVYPAPGDTSVAARVCDVLAPTPVTLDRRWGLDHGAWSVLVHMYPNADIPVLQLSIDETQPAAFQYDLGRRLSRLRDEGVLVIGSGNIVHNLETLAWGTPSVAPFPWAQRFENRARALLDANDHEPLVNFAELGEDAQLSIPTPEHYLPLLYILGARREGEGVRYPVEGIDLGSISMLSVQFGEID
jgi:4,5-DOPA dioxygenase extradiol